MLFNALASRFDLDWVAVSRGLATELGIRNIGAISPYVLKKLKELGVPIEGDIRMPVQLEITDLEEADLVIALNATEHEPLMIQRFAKWADQIMYWNVPDLHRMNAENALSEIETSVTTLVQQLHNHA